jgi:hypothetical protein
MTPQTVLQPFIDKLTQRSIELEHKINREPSTPDERGEMSASSFIASGLRVKLAYQDGTPQWEEAFLVKLRDGFPADIEECNTPYHHAWEQYGRGYADELEKLWIEARVLEH